MLAALLAQAQDASQQSPVGTIALMVGSFFVIFYFFVMRPQQKQQNEQKSFLDKLGKGDDVLAAGGIVAKVDKVLGDIVYVEVANNVKLRVLKTQISALPAQPAPAAEKAEEPKK